MSKIDTKHLVAAVAVADEGSLSKAAIRLNITQSAVSKQILALEDYLGHELFKRNNRRLQTTAAGEIFVKHARLALLIQDRAVQLSREAFVESKTVLHLGKSPYADPFFISVLTGIQRAEFPQLRLDVESNFSVELGRQVEDGILDMAVLTDGPSNPHLSTLRLATNSFYVLVREDHDIAHRKVADLQDLHGRTWIRFARHVHPDLYDRFSQTLERFHVQPSAVHHVTTAEEAVQLVLEVNGIATITGTGAWRVLEKGLTLRPLMADDLSLLTVLAVRSDSDSPVISQFFKAVGKRLCGRNVNTLDTVRNPIRAQ